MSREMKNSGIEWIGQIPQDWDIRNIKHMADTAVINSYIDGDWIESPYVTDEGIRYLTSGNIGDGFYKEQGNSYISEESFAKLNCKFAYPGDLVFSRLNEPYGRSCILPDTEDCYVLAVDDVILRPFSYIDKKYVCYLTMCDGYHRAVGEEARGTAMKRISRTNLGLIKLSLPSLSEQHAIVHFLDRKCSAIDTAIEKTKKSIEKLEEYKKAVITKAVTKGIDPNAKMKDSGSQWIQDIPNKWNNERLKYTITARDGGAWGEEPTKDNPGVICMRIADFNYDDGVFQDKPQEQLTKRLYTNNQINRLMLMQNDICIEKSGGGEKTPVGRTVIFDKAYPALFANFMERLRFNPNIIIPHFGEYWFRAMYSCKVSPVYIKQTTGIQNLDVGTMLAVERIYYPSLPEQRQIVHFLDRKCAAIDTAIEKKKKAIEKWEEYKKSLIYYAVTGKIDCRNEVI